MIDDIQAQFPRIISVDDHVVEPPNVWTDRLPRRYQEVGPRIERVRVGTGTYVGSGYRFGETVDEESEWADCWVYEDLKKPHVRLAAAVGYDRDDVEVRPITYDEMRPGCYDVPERLSDMDISGVEASLCFPTFPRFCGQTFLEASDKDLALLCVRAYNDWMVDEWTALSHGRLIPLCIVPLWDPQLAAEEVLRNAARGVKAVCFSENPSRLGLPSIHDASDYWTPFVQACTETGTVINMHIGSSSHNITTSPDAPAGVQSVLTFNSTMWALVDWLFSGYFARFEGVKIALSEGQMGWVPYVLERVDKVWDKHRGWNGVRELLPEPPSSYFRDHVYVCFFDDETGLELLDRIGVDNVTFETDYPHSDSTWPDSRKLAQEQLALVDPGDVEKILRINAIRLFGLSL